MEKSVRVRYAPSPTGHLHIGNARTALFNYLFARHTGGKFIIRIEDTDLKRNVEGGEENQLKYLRWLGMDWDEGIDKDGGYGPYRQSERKHIYKEYAEKLLRTGKAYKCYCTEEELKAEREAQAAAGQITGYSGKCRHLTEEEARRLEEEGRKPVIRFRVSEGKTYAFDDMVKGHVAFASDEVGGDFVIMKKDGMPTYNFAVVIDDHLMEITHVLRGDDHISNTPKQLMIYEALGWEPPVFGHMSLIVNEERKKLSKRDETIIQFIEQYEELGYLPEAMFNFIALLGWSPEGEQEILSREELIAQFDPKRLSKSPAVFDKQKLTWMNNQYMKAADLDRLVEISLPHLIKAGRLPENMTEEERNWARELIALYQDKMSYGAEIVEKSALFFKEELELEDDAKEVLADPDASRVLAAFLDEVKEADSLTPEKVKEKIKAVQKATGLRGKKLFMPIRAAVTGQTHGPDLQKTIALIGKEKVVERLASVLS